VSWPVALPECCLCSLLWSYLCIKDGSQKGRLTALLTMLGGDDASKMLAIWTGVMRADPYRGAPRDQSDIIMVRAAPTSRSK